MKWIDLYFCPLQGKVLQELVFDDFRWTAHHALDKETRIKNDQDTTMGNPQHFKIG